VPDVPLIVTPTDIGAADVLAANVSVLVPVLLSAPKLAVRPVGNPIGVKLTLLGLNPPDGVMVIVVEPIEPCATLTELGDADKLKSGAVVVAVTVMLTVVVWLNVPEAPVIVTVVGPPTAAVPAAVNVTTLLAHDAVTPAGRPVTEYVGVPEYPFIPVTVTVLVPVLPCMIDRVLGDADRLKSAVAAGVRVYIAV